MGAGEEALRMERPPFDDPTARLCRRCDQPVNPCSPVELLRRSVAAGEGPGERLAELSAWVAGFCSALCQGNHALDLVAAGSAWWQTTRSGS